MKEGQFDIDRYTREYISQHGKSISYEAILAVIRKKHVIEQISKYKHDHILEIGCGLDPLFQYVTNYNSFLIIEPCKEFVENACNIAEGNHKIEVIQGFIEDIANEHLKDRTDFDMVIVSSLLHEVPDTERLLQSVRGICNCDTVIHFNVPNVFSFHRLLAYEMGLISSIFDKSETETKFQRQTRFDKQALLTLLNKERFQVEEFGTYFIKLFTNEQMEKLITEGIISSSLIEGLDRMVKYLPELGCEMYVNAKIYGCCAPPYKT